MLLVRVVYEFYLRMKRKQSILSNKCLKPLKIYATYILIANQTLKKNIGKGGLQTTVANRGRYVNALRNGTRQF